MNQPHIRLLWVFPSFRVDPSTERFAIVTNALGGAYEHAICALDGDYAAESMLGANVRWRRLDPPTRKRRLLSLGNLWSLRRVISAENPDVLVTNNWGGVEWLMVNRGPGSIPHIHFEDGREREDRPDSPDAKRSWTRRRAFAGRERAFVAPSRTLETLLKGDWAAPAEAVHYIPDGVDVGRFSANPRDDKGRTVRLAAIGPLTGEKRGDRLLRMMTELRRRRRDVRLVFVGDGPERRNLEDEARKVGVERFVDFVGEQREIAPFLAQFDIFVQSSDVGQSPKILLQAMASGLPVVATDVGDVSEIVDPSNRLFIRDPSDESALTAAAELLSADPALRAQLGAANALRAAAEFSEEAMIRRYDSLFREMTRKASRLMLPPPATTARTA